MTGGREAPEGIWDGLAAQRVRPGWMKRLVRTAATALWLFRVLVRRGGVVVYS
jgi:hypothetical protein